MRSFNKFILIILSTLLISALLLAGCGRKAGTLRIMSFGYAETDITAEMVKALVESETEFKVEIIYNVASVMIASEATSKGESDMYLTYTGTQLSTVMGQELTEEWMDPVKVRDYVEKRAKEEYGMTLLGNLGFDNTYAVTVKRSFAEANNLRTISDLSAHASDLTIASDYDFLNREGVVSFTRLVETYGLDFKSAVGMDYGLMYRAIDTGDVDAMVAYSSDGRIASMNLFILEDEKNVFPPYDAAFIIRTETLENMPGLEEVLNKLTGRIDMETIHVLNAFVDLDEMDPKEVALNFLREEGLLN